MPHDVATRISKSRSILETMLVRVEAGREGMSGDRERAIRDISATLRSPSFAGVRWLLAPTGNVQDLSIENGWGTEFLEMAEQLEALLELA